ncbi:MAG: GntR family transcriptional regulator [Kiritimatiellae bacterium]|nr:GntR family transcriptional regulator [Kiritimatiellia bacterium]
MRNQGLKRQRVEEELLYWISTGGFQAEDVLPPERELCRRFNVSRITIRAVLESLAGRGIVRREGRRGTVLARAPKSARAPAERRAERSILFCFYPSRGVGEESRQLLEWPIFRGVHKCAEQADHILMFQHGADAEKFLARQPSVIDGVLICGTGTAEKIPLYQQSGVPVVAVDQLPRGHAVDAVACDNYEAGMMCGEHLLAGNRKRTLFVTLAYSGESALQENYALRWEGLQSALGERAEASLHAMAYDGRPLSAFDPEEVAKALARIRRERIDAVVCCSGGVYGALREPLADWARGKRTRDVVFINDQALPVKDKRVAVVHLPMEQMGFLACKRLLEKIATGDRQVLRTLIPAERMERVRTGTGR